MNGLEASARAAALLKRLSCPLVLVLLCFGLTVARAAFVDIHAGLPGLANGRGAWGDYDNDGDLDLILVGFENLVGD